MSSSSSTSLSVCIRLDFLKSLYDIRPSSLVSITKNILMMTVSEYLSWNSGVACKNSRPGWVSSNVRIIGLKSSLSMNSWSGLAITLNSRLDTSNFSYSFCQTSISFCLEILPDLVESILSKSDDLNILEILKSRSTIGKNSSFVISVLVPYTSSIILIFCSLMSMGTGRPSS